MPRTKKKVEAPQDALFVALDIGTATTYAGVKFPDGRVEVMNDPDGNCPTATAFGFENGDPERLLFGRIAMNYRMVHAEWISVINKRSRGQNIPTLLDKEGRSYKAEESEAMFVHWLLASIEERTGMKIGGVVVTVPACFDDAQRKATMDIISQAGFVPIGCINEPTAAVLDFAMKHADTAQTICVVDVGCGTTDVTILSIEPGNLFAVRSTSGRNDLAGQEMTLELVAMCQQTMAAQGVCLTPEDNLRDFVMMQAACEEAKIALSTQSTAFITWRGGAQLFEREVSRQELEQACQPILRQMRDLVSESLQAAGMEPRQVDGAILVGGGSRVPAIRQMVESIFGEEKVLRDIEDPGKAIVLGAAASIGYKIHEAIASGREDLAEIAPEYILGSDIHIQDILGLDLGVLAQQRSTGAMVLAPIITAQCPVPTTQEGKFGVRPTSDGSAIDAKIVVLEGRREAPPEEARVLTEFNLTGLPSGPDQDRIEITFSVDPSGLVNVRAVDLLSGKEITGTVQAGAAIPVS